MTCSCMLFYRHPLCRVERARWWARCCRCASTLPVTCCGRAMIEVTCSHSSLTWRQEKSTRPKSKAAEIQLVLKHVVGCTGSWICVHVASGLFLFTELLYVKVTRWRLSRIVRGSVERRVIRRYSSTVVFMLSVYSGIRALKQGALMLKWTAKSVNVYRFCCRFVTV